MFEGRTIDELIEFVLVAERRARQHAEKSHAEDTAPNEGDTNYFLLGAA
jgi:hypothetical protein